VAVEVPAAEAEVARAAFLALFPAGFEERDRDGGVELAGYAEETGAAAVRAAFPDAVETEVASGWEERWREFHRPVRVGPLWIGPTWEVPPKDAVAVVIEPARAFGTGGHPTTRLCLELLVELRSELAAASVLDVGCGSGVLAVAAWRLGYRPVRAIDVDPAAVEETRRNAAANDATVDVSLADALAADLPFADVVVANIARDTVETLAPRLSCRLLVASGYLDTDPPRLDGFRCLRQHATDGWAAGVYAPEELLARSRHSRV
jgi:ribosomal protein L11 methyltransferase